MATAMRLHITESLLSSEDGTVLIDERGQIYRYDPNTGRWSQMHLPVAARYWDRAEPELVDDLVSRAADSLVRLMETRGMLLLHAALIQRDGQGVLLAAAGDVGKTTAAMRAPSPWQVVCDDAALVALDRDGRPTVHAWPTWSAITDSRRSESWDVGSSLPLAGIAFIERAPSTRLRRFGPGHAAVRIAESAEQLAATWHPVRRLDQDRRARLRRFRSACSLAPAVPAFGLELTLDGDYWSPLQRALELRG
jgi:SynChlorMet cassette protein ScmC